MAKAHFLKCAPEPFEAVKSGLKKFEYRKFDRDFEVGDVIVLQKFESFGQRYFDSQIAARIEYMLTAGSGFGVPDGYCVMSIRVIRP